MSRLLIAGLFLILTSIGGQAADGLEVPKGKVILSIEGSITKTNTPDGKAIWDLKMLEDFSFKSFKTKTPWLEGVTEFNGVLMRDLMNAVGAKGQTIVAYASDGYSNEVSLTDFKDYDVILALSMNGKRLDPEDKGHLWIMYPFDDHLEMDVEEKSAHAVWQLSRIVVRE